MSVRRAIAVVFFFFNDTATTEIYTLSLHDALPISLCGALTGGRGCLYSTGSLPGSRYGRLRLCDAGWLDAAALYLDRKSTRLNSSHGYISYAVFCLKKKKKIRIKNYNLERIQ